MTQCQTWNSCSKKTEQEESDEEEEGAETKEEEKRLASYSYWCHTIHVGFIHLRYKTFEEATTCDILVKKLAHQKKKKHGRFLPEICQNFFLHSFYILLYVFFISLTSFSPVSFASQHQLLSSCSYSDPFFLLSYQCTP